MLSFFSFCLLIVRDPPTTSGERRLTLVFEKKPSSSTHKRARVDEDEEQSPAEVYEAGFRDGVEEVMTEIALPQLLLVTIIVITFGIFFLQVLQALQEIEDDEDAEAVPGLAADDVQVPP